MLRESWKRPSVLLFGWASILVLVFVFTGDLRVERTVDESAPPAASREPVVVRPQRPRTDEQRVVRNARVYDASGFLVAGAEVTVGGDTTERTDADGRFRVEVVAGQTVDVTVRVPGHAIGRLRVQMESPEPLLVQLAPAAPWDREPEPLPPLRFAGEGRVVDPVGRPVVGAHVTALGTDSWALTDASGRYQLPLADATPVLAAHDDREQGMATRTEPLQLERVRGIVPLPELVAVAACTLRGIVRDGRGAPVVGVPVRLRGEGLERLVETGAGGAFRIGGLEPGHYTLRPFAFRGMVGAPQSLTVDRAQVDCDLLLCPASEQRLRVVDTTGAPVAGAAVAAVFAGERTSLQRTDADGWTLVRLGDAPLGEAWAFDVRVGEALAEPSSTRLEAEQATLVVAMP